MSDLSIIPSSDNAITMTSLELVEYINSQREAGSSELAHSDFLKKVPLVLGGGAGNFSFTYRDVQNKERPCYRFQKREACLMAMSYSYDLQAKVFDRMTALEEKAKNAAHAFAIPQSFTEALRLAADLAEGKAKAEMEVAQKQKLLELAAPKVAMVDRIGASEGTRCLTDAAKELKVPRHALITFLEKNRWIYKRPLNDTWLAYDDKRHQSLLEHAYVPITKTNGETYDKPQVRITMKGLMKLAQLLNQTSNDDHAKGAA
jgi:phage antirepressor YoqD-like protein